MRSRVLAELHRGQQLGWHTGAQLYASVNGEPRFDVATGTARPAVPMTTTTIVEWASATKPVTCAALAILWERGLLSLEDPVREHLPEFTGKDEVTIQHLLTHTAGVTSSLTGRESAAEYVADICASPRKPGFAYNSPAMWLIAEIVSRRAEQPFDDFLREQIFEPAGMTDCWLAMPLDVFDQLEPRLAILPGIPRSGTADWVTWGRPTGGIHGPINQLARFYESLGRLLAPETLATMTFPHVFNEYDELLQATVSRGLGFALTSTNPAHDLVAAVYWNGPATPTMHSHRVPQLLNALYKDLFG